MKDIVKDIVSRYEFDAETCESYKEAAALIMYSFGIDGSTDPMYLCNVIGNCCEHGKLITKEKAEEIADFLIGTKTISGAYTSSIPKIARNYVIEMLECGHQTDVYHLRYAIRATRDAIKQRFRLKKYDLNQQVYEAGREKRLSERQTELSEWLKEKRKWDAEHYSQTTARAVLHIKKTLALAYAEYEQSEEPCKNALYGALLAVKQASDGANLALYADVNEANRPCVRIVINQAGREYVTSKTLSGYYSSFTIQAGEMRYFIGVERITPETAEWKSKAYQEAYIRRGLPYPQSLISDIIGKTWYEPLPKEMAKNLELAINSLPEQQRSAVRLWYQTGATLREIGDLFGISQERARHLKVNALHHLREPARLCQYCPDPETSAKLSAPAVQTKPQGTEIESCGFSTRLYNCLRRAGIYTLEQLLEHTWEQIMEIRNLGNSSMKELMQCLKNRGVTLAGDTPEWLEKENSKEETKNWVMTDDDSVQYRREAVELEHDGEKVFELYQLQATRDPADVASKDPAIYGIAHDFIYVSEIDMQSVLDCYGYGSVDEVREAYGQDWMDAILAECQFELDAGCLENLCERMPLMTWEKAKETIEKLVQA